jgi:predicted metal-binding membrane protein
MPLGVGVAVVLAICWAYLIGMAWGMEMMMAMMLPSAVPLLFLLFRTHLASSGRHRALLLCGTVALGYLTAWTGFSLLATLAQWGSSAEAPGG